MPVLCGQAESRLKLVELFDRANIEFTTVKSLHQINPEILIFVSKHSTLQIWPPKFQLSTLPIPEATSAN
jgi:hypothetical protein